MNGIMSRAFLRIDEIKRLIKILFKPMGKSLTRFLLKNFSNVSRFKIFLMLVITISFINKFFK